MKRVKTRITPKDEKMLYFYASLDVPYYFIPESIRNWLETGGLEEIKKEKPMMAKWIENMRKDIYFPKDLKLSGSFIREAEKLMKEKGCLKEDEYLRESEIFNFIRFRNNPFYSRSDRIYCLAETTLELLEKKLKENPDREDIKELIKIVKYWININKKIKESDNKGNKDG